MKGKTVLITGASGLIGSSIVERLLHEGARVVCMARSYPLTDLGLDTAAVTDQIRIQGDIRDRALLDEAFARHQPTHFVHLAAQPIVGAALADCEPTFDVNVRGTWLALEAARQFGQLESIVVASSDKAYGSHDTLPYREDFPLRARFPYDVSKQAAEEIALAYHHTYGLPISITRCGNVFGPGDLNMSRLVPGTILSCLQDRDILIRSSGLQERCFVYSSDVADAYVRLLSAPASRVAGQAFNIGSPDALSVLAMAGLIREALPESRSEVIVQDHARGEIERQSLCCEKAAAVLGWQPKVPLPRALAETVGWYRAALPALAPASATPP